MAPPPALRGRQAYPLIVWGAECLLMPPQTIAETQLFNMLKRIADELDKINTTLLLLIEAIREPTKIIPPTQLDNWLAE